MSLLIVRTSEPDPIYTPTVMLIVSPESALESAVCIVAHGALADVQLLVSFPVVDTYQVPDEAVPEISVTTSDSDIDANKRKRVRSLFVAMIVFVIELIFKPWNENGLFISLLIGCAEDIRLRFGLESLPPG